MKNGVTIISMDTVEAVEVQWLWKPYIPLGKLTIIQGDPGEGKTTLALYLVSLLSQGKFFDESGNLVELEPVNVLYQTAEDGLADTVKPRLISVGADCARIKVIDDSGHLGSLINMAYMLRRGEAKSDKYTVEELLAPLVNENNALAVVNYILKNIKHSDNHHTFDEAINLLRKIGTIGKDYNQAVNWWTDLSDQKSDPEGDLVLGLLMYVGKMDSGAKNEDMQNRLQTASEAGYAIADYVLTKI